MKYRFPYNKKDGSGASSTEVSTIDRAVIVGMGPALSLIHISEPTRPY